MKKKVSLVAVFAVILPAAVWGQIPAPDHISGQINGLYATDGLDADDYGADTSFIDVNGWEGLEFDKVFLFLGGGLSGYYTGQLSAGTAFRIAG
jgi:hypothetical protein